MICNNSGWGWAQSCALASMPPYSIHFVCSSTQGAHHHVAFCKHPQQAPLVRYQSVILDMTVLPNASDLEPILQIAALVLHQDERNACLVLYPLPYHGLSFTRKLRMERLIEDRLMGSNLQISKEIVITYQHDGSKLDNRVLAQRARLCTSGRIGENSGWLQSAACKGRIGPVDLCRVRDMHTSDMQLDPGRMAPADRIMQRGPEAPTAPIAG